jgi:uncharacterized membrane protein YoaK (UPF0700 family)
VKIGLGVLLTAIAGCVDAVGYLALGGFFASFMSGASISLGVAMGEGHWDAVCDEILLIAAFLASATAATVVAGVTGAWALPTVLLLEGGLLAGAVLLAGTGWPASVSIFPVVAAMGVQNTALRPADGMRLGVTFMTGTLVSLGQGLGGALLRRRRPWNWSPHALLWCAFVAGAAVGASHYAAFGFMAVSAPAALVAAMAVLVSVMVLFERRTRTPGGSNSPR